MVLKKEVNIDDELKLVLMKSLGQQVFLDL